MTEIVSATGRSASTVSRYLHKEFDSSEPTQAGEQDDEA
jgi:hypothetical protein